MCETTSISGLKNFAFQSALRVFYFDIHLWFRSQEIGQLEREDLISLGDFFSALLRSSIKKYMLPSPTSVSLI